MKDDQDSYFHFEAKKRALEVYITKVMESQEAGREEG